MVEEDISVKIIRLEEAGFTIGGPDWPGGVPYLEGFDGERKYPIYNLIGLISVIREAFADLEREE